MPEGAEVTLLADRGLAWPQIIDACGELGWHFVIRLQGQTRVRTSEGSECSADELAPNPGTHWWGQAEVFKDAGWRTAQIATSWEKDQGGPWLLVSDRPQGARLFHRYATRVWTEELFRDEKSQGFHWEQSHVTDPMHAARLVLLIGLATYLALGLGSRVIQAGLTRWQESTRQRMLSLFTIGIRWMMFCLTHERSLPNNVSSYAVPMDSGDIHGRPVRNVPGRSAWSKVAIARIRNLAVAVDMAREPDASPSDGSGVPGIPACRPGRLEINTLETCRGRVSQPKGLPRPRLAGAPRGPGRRTRGRQPAARRPGPDQAGRRAEAQDQLECLFLQQGAQRPAQGGAPRGCRCSISSTSAPS